MKTLFKGAKIIDGTGSEPILCGEILIDDNKIIEVSQLNAINTEANDIETIDVSGKVIIPGLINSHLHILANAELDASLFVAAQESETFSAFRGYKNLRTLLLSGVTYARDLGGPNHINIELKKARQSGLIDGSEIVTAGEAITTTGGHIWKISRECDGIADVRKAVREQIKAGADCIKMMITGGYSTPGVHPKTVQFTQDEISAASEVAHFANKKISAHTYGLKAIKMAVEGGIDSIEHCEFFPDDDPREVALVIEKMANKGIYYVPTISAWFKDFTEEYGKLGEIKAEFLDKQLLRQPDHVRPMNVKREYYSLRQIFENATRIYQAGVKIVMGTDSGIRGIYFDKHPFEMKCMQYMGMSSMEVLVSATKTAAELLGISIDYGTLEKGKIADLVILNKDPLLNMDHLYDIHKVYKKGHIVT